MIKDLTDRQLAELAAMLNVTLTAQNAALVYAQVQLKLLTFEIADELEKRSDRSK